MSTVAQERASRTRPSKRRTKPRATPPIVLTEAEHRRRAEKAEHEIEQAKIAAQVDAERAAFRDDSERDPKSLYMLITEAVASGECLHDRAFLVGALASMGDDLDALFSAITDSSGYLSTDDGTRLDLEKLPTMLFRLSMRARAVVEISERYAAVQRLEAGEHAA